MKAIHDLHDRVFDVDDFNALERKVREYLASKNIPHAVEAAADKVVVSYPDVENMDADEDERIVIMFCNSRRFEKARKVAKEWIGKTPWNSEAYRLLAQIEMENKEFDLAIEHCKDSLRLNPKNLHALILLGNLLSRDKNLVDEGMAWYKRACDLYPDSVLAVNNYAGALMQKGGADSATLESLFRKAIELAPSYLNPYYGLAEILMARKDLSGTFRIVQEGLRRGQQRPENDTPIKEMLTEKLLHISAELARNLGTEIVDKKRAELESAGGVGIDIDEDVNLSVPAKLELAEHYGRERHRLVCNPLKTQHAKAYYLMHELEKQQLRISARNAGKSALFMHDDKGFEQFVEQTRLYITERFRAVVPHSEFNQMLQMLMKGVGGQLMNCPLDMLVASRLYGAYAELRPCQVIAAYELARESIASVEVGTREGFPENIVHVNKVLNAVSFLQYRELLGLDFLGKMPISKDELKLAKELYEIARGYMDSFSPGDEWTLVRTFLEKMHCDSFFKVIDEEAKHAEEERKKESTLSFQERFTSGKDVALNMAITMYMVEAIKRLGSYDISKVRKIAVEIAMLGMRGIHPDDKSGYSVPSLDNEDMGGSKMLAYYYVSWKIGFPDKVSVLGLPFDKEYAQALELGKAGL